MFSAALLVGGGVLGIALLIKSSDILIDGAEALAARLRIPPLVVGIVIVGLGTSTPELFINLISALGGDTDLAYGNIVGSNISNIGLVVGVAGMVAGTIRIERSIVSAEIPVMMASAVLLGILLFDGWGGAGGGFVLSRQDGAVLLLGLVMYLVYTFNNIAGMDQGRSLTGECDDGTRAQLEKFRWPTATLKVLGGVTGLYLGGSLTVWGATGVAELLGAGTMTVGVIIGLGTSLPELAAAIAAVRKRKPDLVIGNVVGSNVFNILLILGLTAFAEPVVVTAAGMVHLLFLVTTTLVFFVFLGTRLRLARWEASLLTMMGIGYLIFSMMFG